VSVLGIKRIQYAIIILIVHLLLHPPFIMWASRIEPMIAGIPFSFFYIWIVYIVLWIILFFICGAMERLADKEDSEV